MSFFAVYDRIVPAANKYMATLSRFSPCAVRRMADGLACNATTLYSSVTANMRICRLGEQLMSSRAVSHGTVTTPAALLFRHILPVGLCAAQKQMLGSNAGWIITVMADIAVGRDRTKSQFPNYTVSKNSSTLFLYPQAAVTRGVLSPYPAPACLGLFNLRPEAVGNWRHG